MLNNTWPYSRLVAHRGAGLSAPENTLAAFQFGFDSGFTMFECDAKLSSDGIVYLLHDATLNRTTNAQGLAHHYAWNELSKLDAGSWHSEWFSGSGIPTLEQVTDFCIAHNCQLNIEIKPSPGFEALTGEHVAQQAKSLWLGQPIQPLLTSFKREALQSAKKSAQDLPRGLLMHELPPDWQEISQSLECAAIACHYPIISNALLEKAHRLGLYCLAYTVNDADTALNLLKIGVDSIVTDDMTFGRSLMLPD